MRHRMLKIVCIAVFQKRREKKKQEKEQEHIANSGGAGDVKHETANGVR